MKKAFWARTGLAADTQLCVGESQFVILTS